MVSKLSAFQHKNQAFIRLVSIVSTILIGITGTLSHASSDGCSEDIWAYPKTCANAKGYLRSNDNSLEARAVKIITPVLRDEGTLQFLDSGEVVSFSVYADIARVSGCDKRICVGQLVKAENYSQTFRVIGHFRDSNKVIAKCENSTCSKTSAKLMQLPSSKLSVTDKVLLKDDVAKSVDNSALSDLENEFKSFEGITMDQYLRLKQSRNAKLLIAQSMVHQFIKSTEIELVSNPVVATDKELEAEINRRQQFFKSAVIFQTGLEIIAHEMLKPAEEIKCLVVKKTLRFLALGVDGWGKDTPGLDYNLNQLLLMHLYIAFVHNKDPNSLPCQDEILDLTIKNPSLKNQPRPGCEVHSYDYDCMRLKGKFWDSETQLALTKIVRAYTGPRGEFYFSGGGGSFRYGLLGNKGGYSSNYETGIFFDAPEAKSRRSALLVYDYQRPQNKGAIFQSSVRLTLFRDSQAPVIRPLQNGEIEVIIPRDEVSDNEVPQFSSVDIFKHYSDLGKLFFQ